METKNLSKQLEILGVEVIGLMTKILAENDKQVTGNLIRSLDFKVIKDIDGAFLQILAAPYFKYVDEGRRPGRMPPIKPIKKWVENRGIKIKKYTSQQSAFIIARSIGKRGIKPLNVKNQVMTEILKKKETIIRNGAVKDIENLLNDILFTSIKK